MVRREISASHFFNKLFSIFTAKAYLESCKTSKMNILAKIVNGFRPLTISAKSTLSDI